MCRVHSVAIGCFREAQPQGPLFGDEPGEAVGMSRPTAARRISPKLPDAQPRLFAFRIYEAAVRDLRQPAM